MSLSKYPKNEWILWEDIKREDYEHLHGVSALVYNGWINTTIISHLESYIVELEEFYEGENYSQDYIEYEIGNMIDYHKDCGIDGILFDYDSSPHNGVTHIMFLEAPILNKEK